MSLLWMEREGRKLKGMGRLNEITVTDKMN
jgi:hypothetical protein